MSIDLLTDDIDAEELFAGVAERMNRLRKTASKLRAGTINAHHAANRIERIADEISRAKEAKEAS